MLSAELNYRYFGELAAMFQRRDRIAKIFVAVATSSAVGAWAIWQEQGFDWIWKLASGLAAVVAIALPIVDPAASLKVSAGLRGSWFSILKDYEMLWTQVDELEEPEARRLCEKIVKEEKRVADLEPPQKVNRRIARRCEAEVRASRGLPIPTREDYRARSA